MALHIMTISWVQEVIPRKRSLAMIQKKSSSSASSNNYLTRIQGQVTIMFPSRPSDLDHQQLRLSKELFALISFQRIHAMLNPQATTQLEKKVLSEQVRLFRLDRNAKSVLRRLLDLESMTLRGPKVLPKLELLAQ